MHPASRERSDDPPAGSATSHRVAVVLLALAGAMQIAYGLAAIAGLGTLEDNVEQIESNPNFGALYFSLGGWGVLLAVVGLANLAAAGSLGVRRPLGRIAGLSASLIALGVAFFTLAIFREASLISVAILLVVLYMLTYRVDDPPESTR